MIGTKINNKWYFLKTEYHEVTIQVYSELLTLEVPEKLKELYKGDLSNYKEVWDNLTEKEWLDYPVFFGDVLRILSDMPSTIIERLLHKDRTNFYLMYHEKFIIDFIRGCPSVQSAVADDFTFKGKTYQLPKSLRVFGEVIPGHGATALQFTEANDLLNSILKLKELGFDGFSEFVAVYTMGKSYTDEQLAERINEFKELTMDVVWQVFFYMQRLLNTELTDLKTFGMVQVLQQKKKMLLMEVNWGNLKLGLKFWRWLRLEYLETLRQLKDLKYTSSLRQ